MLTQNTSINMEKKDHPGVMCIYLLQLVTPPHSLHIPEILTA